MSERALERQIQEFLDGRLSEGEREAFERRLAADAELARRVELYRELGGALREEPAELDPAFYTRLKAEFVARRPARAERRWFRLLSWETAGLVAVVALAGILFVPALLREEIPRAPAVYHRPQPPPPKVEDADAAPAPSELESPGRLERRDEPEEPAPETGAPADLSQKREVTGRAEKKDAPPAAGGPSSAVTEETRGLAGREPEQDWAPEPQGEAASEPEPVAEAPTAAEPAPARSLEKAGFPRTLRAPKTGAATGPPAVDERASVVEVQSSERLRAREGQLREAAGGRFVESIPLSPGLVEPGTVVEIDDEAEWNRRQQEAGEDSFGSGLRLDAGQRIVMVGPHPSGFSCTRALLVETQESYELRLAGEPTPQGATPTGCAFRLPDDGKSIRVSWGQP